MTSRADRGKSAEKQVEAWLAHLNEKFARFAWHRFPDPRSTRGMVKQQPCDYLVQVPGGTTLLEVKELEHAFRIPAKNISQLPTLKKFHMAGARTAILIHFKPINKWRCVDASKLEARSTGSWDMSEVPTHDTPEQAFVSVFGDIDDAR